MGVGGVKIFFSGVAGRLRGATRDVTTGTAHTCVKMDTTHPNLHVNI